MARMFLASMPFEDIKYYWCRSATASSASAKSFLVEPDVKELADGGTFACGDLKERQNALQSRLFGSEARQPLLPPE